jgi:hypothetical protein
MQLTAPLCPYAEVHPVPDPVVYDRLQCFATIREGVLNESEVIILQCFLRSFGFPVSVTLYTGETFQHARWLADSSSAAATSE